MVEEVGTGVRGFTGNLSAPRYCHMLMYRCATPDIAVVLFIPILLS